VSSAVHEDDRVTSVTLERNRQRLGYNCS